MYTPAFLLICLEQKDRSLEAHLEDFLFQAPATTFPDSSLCSFLNAGLNTATKAQLSGEGPRGSFPDYVEWVLASCGSPMTVGIDYNDTSPTATPVPSQEPPDGVACQRNATGDREPASTAMQEPATSGTTERNIGAEPEHSVSDQVCEFAATSVAEGVSEEHEGLEWSPAHTPATETLSHACYPALAVSHHSLSSTPASSQWRGYTWACCEPASGSDDLAAPPPASDPVVTPRLVVLTPPPLLLPPSCTSETIELSAPLDSLGPSTPPGSDIASTSPQTYGSFEALRPSTPTAPIEFAFPQAPSWPSVVAAPPQPFGTLLPPRGAVAATPLRTLRPSASLRSFGSLSSSKTPPPSAALLPLVPKVAWRCSPPRLFPPATPP
ncbi:hypothetical protein DPX16_22583 [Anabarilius grahami]|uniref:Uncharacterized protein n=1 Tax=Anabarilius grahami TaxID=495550 RepID=A0A3N0XGW0_ANAGA|nr:hypothetical protein DPX16_22583 [Anabarilius grahami]